MADPNTTAPAVRYRREMVLSVAGGEVRLSFPDPMDAVDLADVRGAIEIWFRGIERRARKEADHD